jgi:hypothetical protein
MAHAKDMIELFQPLNIKLVLNVDNPYFDIDGVRTYIFTAEGEISQNAIEALIKYKSERDKYKKDFERLRAFIIAAMDEGSPAQEGNRIFETDDKDITKNGHKDALEELARKIFKSKDKVEALMKAAVAHDKKRSLKIDGVFI